MDTLDQTQLLWEDYDAIFIGGGFYGCCLAVELAQRFDRVLMLEREPDVLTRASYANQARVHNGYHYPRSLLTAKRSAANYPRFTEDFADCIDRSFVQVYAIARETSKVTAYQFRKFCERVGIQLVRAPQATMKLFNPALIEDAFCTEECAFNAAKLRLRMKTKLQAAGVEVACYRTVDRISPGRSNSLRIVLADGTELNTSSVFNCTYSQTNRILERSGLPKLPLKHEITELALIKVPPPLEKLGVTVMDGPFFSTMPFPALNLHTLSHVRYTPHAAWNDNQPGRHQEIDPNLQSKSIFMLKDSQRYLPILQEAVYVRSLFETKTVLLQNEVDDGRPILCRRDYALNGLSVILGAKIDNIYDIIKAFEKEHFSPRSTYYETCH